MSYETLEYASSFCSEQCPEGFVCVAGNTLRILTLERLGEVFNQQVLVLVLLLGVEAYCYWAFEPHCVFSTCMHLSSIRTYMFVKPFLKAYTYVCSCI